ncbi:MAG: threonine-phosphate decarboxylase [Brevundimonas sp.]|nr:threonine-phosphate decarboxylase [Brevundimonas sp.]
MTGAIPHGGRLARAQADYPSAPALWLDLSTGINPEGWRRGRPGLDSLSRLPDPADILALEAAAAASFGVRPECVVAVAGAEAGLRLLPETIAGGRVAVASPTYGSHADAWRRAGRAVQAVARADLFDADAEVLVIVNPNNPDGAVSPGAELVAKAAGRWLIIDESFVEADPNLSAAPLAQGRTIVLRSFGKFYGLAGVRLGFVISDETLAERIRRRIGDWPVGAEAIAMGRAAYADTAWGERTRRALTRDAARLDRLLEATGFEVLGGTILFRLVRCANACERADKLARQGVLVRTFSHDETLIRFGLPSRKNWRRLQAALEMSQ